MSEIDLASTVATAREYYDGPADEIYRLVWGDNLHVGVSRGPGCSHAEAMAHTNEIMAGYANLNAASRVLDLGCGYGATARYLAQTYSCRVVGINISEKELALARERAAASGLESLLTFETGDFHQLRFEDKSFDVAWSQDSFLHGADKSRIISEARRVLVDGGTLIFTDLLVRADTPESDRARVYDRVKSPEMWDAGDYRRCLVSQGFDIRHEIDWSANVAPSYSRVRSGVLENREALLTRVDAATIERTLEGLAFWVDAANDGKIGWSLFVATKGNGGGSDRG